MLHCACAERFSRGKNSEVNFSEDEAVSELSENLPLPNISRYTVYIYTHCTAWCAGGEEGGYDGEKKHLHKWGSDLTTTI